MSTIGKDVTLQQIDSDGNIYKLFPVTRADNVMSETGKKVTEVMEENRLEAERAVLSEKTQREEADGVLQDNINTEASIRETNDNTLQSNINSEAIARENSDNALQDNIDAEALTRETNDNTLQQNIDNEAAIRKNNDDNLQKQIDDNDKDILALQNKNSDLNTETGNLQEQITNNKKTFEDFTATKGEADGFASLDSNGLVPSSQLPSYVDDVVEVYATYTKSSTGTLSDIILYSDASHTKAISGEAGKIYVNIASGEPSYTFRYSGSAFVHIDSGSLILGEIAGTAYDGKKGKDLSTELTAHENDFNNPHNVTLAQLGLSLVDNTPDSEKEVAYADLAGQATSDSRGQQIDSTYVKDVHISPTGSLVFDRGNGNTMVNPVTLAGTNTIGFVKTTSDVTDIVGLTACPIVNGVVYYRGIEGEFSEATTTSAGLMSAADKVKLNGISAGANKYTLPTAGTTLGGVKTTSTVTSTAGLTACPIIGGVVYYDAEKITYSLSKSGSTITLTGSDGSTSSVTDSNTYPAITSTCTTVQNQNINTYSTVLYNGFYYLNGCNYGGTSLGNGYLIVMRYTSNYIVQYYTSYGGGPLQSRVMNNGTWSSWSVSSLSNHTHSYLPLTGGRLTGTLYGVNAAFSSSISCGGLGISTGSNYVKFDWTGQFLTYKIDNNAGTQRYFCISNTNMSINWTNNNGNWQIMFWVDGQNVRTI